MDELRDEPSPIRFFNRVGELQRVYDQQVREWYASDKTVGDSRMIYTEHVRLWIPLAENVALSEWMWFEEIEEGESVSSLIAFLRYGPWDKPSYITLRVDDKMAETTALSKTIHNGEWRPDLILRAERAKFGALRKGIQEYEAILNQA